MYIQLEQGTNRCQIITDTYNADLVGLQAVLQFMNRQNSSLDKTLILSHLWPLDLESNPAYYALAELLKTYHISQFIGIGPTWFIDTDAFWGIDTHFFVDTSAFLKSPLCASLQKRLIAIKGPENNQVAWLSQQLSQKCHSTVLEVDLDAVAHNLHFFRSKLAPNTQVLAMVKALAYGSSYGEIAQLLAFSQVDYLAVAYVDEGVYLREQGITVPIMVMCPIAGSFQQLINYQLEPVIYSLEILSALQEFLANQEVRIGIHLELETGMHRLGISAIDLEALIKVLNAHPAIQPKSVMTQLAGSGSPHHDAYTHIQARLFEQMASQIEAHLGTRLKKHILNTSGIVRFPAYHFDMVRLGIGLYGVGVDMELQSHLQVASRLKTTIMQIKQISAGATVGYERQGKAVGERTIATLAIGYADGVSRALGNSQGKVWINGKLAPILGNVCMDMLMVDITHISAQPGDEAIIFGPENPIGQVAASANTIAYELLTNVSERVRRVYYTKQ